MLFNQKILHLKNLYLDTTPKDILIHVAKTFVGEKAKLKEIPRFWTPGGGSQNYLAYSEETKCFIKAKHKLLFVESALESEQKFSTIHALKNEFHFLKSLQHSQHVPKVIGLLEYDDYVFLATEFLDSFESINSFNPELIVESYKLICEFIKELYNNKIVHTDIHEKNICFRGTVPVLIDFEEARYLHQSVPFEKSLDVTGVSEINNVGEFPTQNNESIRGLTCLNRLKLVFKNKLCSKLPTYLSQCHFDCSSAFNLDEKQQPDNRIYQSINLPGITISGQRPINDPRLGYVQLALNLTYTTLKRKINVIDLGSNMGMISFYCSESKYVNSITGLEADPRYISASNILSFYSDKDDKVYFENYTTGTKKYSWTTDLLIMLSVYHHIPNKDSFLYELKDKNITCIIAEFATQNRYYSERGNLTKEIEHIRKSLNFRHAEYISTSSDYKRPIVIFHNSPTKIIISNNLTTINTLKLHTKQNKSAARALSWIHKHSIINSGICISNTNQSAYPEVTGYLIPTLIQWNEIDLAIQYARWLISIQHADGSFSGPNTQKSFAFDTGQIIRGLSAVAPYFNDAYIALEKSCDWILRTSSKNGRIILPDSMKYWSLDRRGFVNEAIHLYVLPGLISASKILNTSKYTHFAHISKNYYINNCNLTNFNAPNMLLHFYCYIQEALFDLGAEDICQKGMRDLAELQTDRGLIPGYADVSWVCTPGLIQAALVWLKLGDIERALPSLKLAESLQTSSGGFPGSVGEGANYFPNEEPSWATKFWLDAISQKEIFLQNSLQKGTLKSCTSSESDRFPVKFSEIPIIQLQKSAIHTLEQFSNEILKNSLPPSSIIRLDEITKTIPILLDWGRRELAFSLTEYLTNAIINLPGWNDGTWNKNIKFILQANLIQTYRQPELLSIYGDTILKQLCLGIFRHHRNITQDTVGIFSCMDEIRKASLYLQDTGWDQYTTKWAKKQLKLPNQQPSHDLVQEVLSFGNLVDAQVGISMLKLIASSIESLPANTHESKMMYTELALSVAWAAWELDNEPLGFTALCKAITTINNSSNLQSILKQNIFLSQIYLKSIISMQRCNFKINFSQFLNDIAPNDGRLDFVRPKSCDSYDFNYINS